MFGDRIDRMRDAESARIARWFRDGTHGLIYFDRKNRAIPISDAERERWEGQALRRLETYLQDLDRAPMEILILAVSLLALGFVLRPLFAPLISIEPFALTLLACFWPLNAEFRFRRDEAEFRRSIEERTFLRTPLPPEIAEARRRHNAFAFITAFAAVGVILVAAVATFRDDPGFGTWAMFGFFALAWLFSLAAQRVDAVHRRKLW